MGKKFEYHEERFEVNEYNDERIMELGADGWELVAVTQEMFSGIMNKILFPGKLRYTFKRETK